MIEIKDKKEELPNVDLNINPLNPNNNNNDNNIIDKERNENINPFNYKKK
jgi:hypothetical protein